MTQWGYKLAHYCYQLMYFTVFRTKCTLPGAFVEANYTWRPRKQHYLRTVSTVWYVLQMVISYVLYAHNILYGGSSRSLVVA